MTEKPSIKILGKTDMGRVRKNNEDAFVAQKLWDDNTFLAIAVDGVGGYEGGEIAAEIASKTIPTFLSASPNGERIELLKQAVTAANNAIFDAREIDPNHSQMSCVLTAAIIDMTKSEISMAHVGDTRLYSFHKGVLNKLSHDHSIIGYREEVGDLSEEAAMKHPQRNVIGRDVGSQRHKVNDEDFIDAQVFPLKPNTTLLLCSDGLTDLVTSKAISSVLKGNETLDEKADLLINAALNAGGKDNVTVVLFEYLVNESEEVVVKEEQKMDDDVETSETKISGLDTNGCEPLKRRKTIRASVSILLIILSFILGVIMTFLFMPGGVNQLKSRIELQQRDHLDSISVLQPGINNRNSSLDTLKSSNDVQTAIDSLLRQNDSLKIKINELEKQKVLLEKEIKLFVTQLDALKENN